VIFIYQQRDLWGNDRFNYKLSELNEKESDNSLFSGFIAKKELLLLCVITSSILTFPLFEKFLIVHSLPYKHRAEVWI